VLPPLVRRALELERAQGLARSCAPEVGRLLHVLAASRGRSRVAEIGTGTGVGSAWLVAALAPHVPFFTAEPDPARAAAAGEFFRDDENVQVLAGDWREELPPEAPFDLLAVPAAEHLHPEEDGELAIGLLAPGGLAVLGGVTPAARKAWLEHPGLAAATEVGVAATHVVLAVRR
jgi:predicted O-methyltransferase YrrM